MEQFMEQALALAELAAQQGDVPVGCLIVKDGAVIAQGYNRRECDRDACAHAEVEAIRAACQKLGTWRLSGCSLLVTLEPCPMCAGAIMNARLDAVYYGARDEKAGACGSVLNLFMERFPHKVRVYGGILEEQCAAQLQRFFQNLR